MFSISGKTSFLFDGSFDHSKDLKGQQTLTFTSIPYKKSALLPDTTRLSDTAKIIVLRLSDFLNNTQIVFTKVNNLPWQSSFRDQVLAPSQSPVYFSLIDTVMLPQRDGEISVLSDKKNSVDIVSLGLNGRILLDQILLLKKKKQEEILLDTGMNIIIVYADNFGNSIPNHGKFNFCFGDKKFQLDFTNKADSAATFIAAKIYCNAEKYNETYFPLYSSAGYPPVAQDEKLISSLTTKSKTITLAVWDDAVEDGDSVSIKIEDGWIVRGFPVLKKPQFIPVTLKPGRNTIIFSGDNLGSIPPNTSVLEIIDGTKRKAFYIETGVGEKNVLRIFYDH